MANEPLQASKVGFGSVSSDDVAFYAQIGICLMEWADVDMVLFDIFVEILNVSDEIASVIYDRTPTL